MKASKMASKNETIADIVAQIRAAAHIQNADSPSEVMYFADRIEAAHKREIEELRAKIKVAEDALTNSPCGVIYQLGISDDDGNFYDGVVIKFDEAEVLKMPRVRQGDKFRVLPLNALAAI